MFRRWLTLLDKSCLLLAAALPLLWLSDALDMGTALTANPLLWIYFSLLTLASNVISKGQSVGKASFWQWLEQLLLLLVLILCAVVYLSSAPPTQRVSALLSAGSIASSLVLFSRCWLAMQQPEQPNQACQPTYPAPVQPPWLIGYASQTGYAEQLARQTASQFSVAGIACSLRSLSDLNPAMLSQYSGALLVVSTYGEGEAPDNALQFQQQASRWHQALPQLPFAILALGDRSYQQFCGFGHWLHQWFCQRQARALQAVVELDSRRSSSEPLKDWQQLLANITNQQGANPAQQELPAQALWLPSQLISRYLANPGSQGAPCFVIKLAVPAGSLWQAGDIVAIQPQNSKCDVAMWLTRHQLYGCQQVQYQGQPMPLCCALAKLALTEVSAPAKGDALEPWLAQQPGLPLRHYSIASIPSEGQLTLLVRQVTKPDGSLGIGSGWLTSWLSEQQPIQLQLRRHSHFQLPDDSRPLLFIANGTGIAGIRALLAERVARGQRDNWLIFGERNQQTDFFFAKDIQRWQQQGFISRCQLIFSRDQAEKRYVQHCLAEQAVAVRELVDAGGAIYVCGSLQGMGTAVQSVLIEILGSSQIHLLQQQGRYCRDLY